MQIEKKSAVGTVCLLLFHGLSLRKLIVYMIIVYFFYAGVFHLQWQE